MIVCKLDVKKINKAHLYVGTKTTYLDLALIPNTDGRDRFGNDGMVVQGVSKELRAQGTKGAILGNYIDLDAAPKAAPQPKVTGQEPLGPEDDLPF